nr:hypothetical protein [Streptomyces boncukensis]
MGKIIYLRQNDHLGPEKIAMRLKRYQRHDRRWKRYEKQLPGHRVQIDVKFIGPLASIPQGRCGGRSKYFQFTAIQFLDYVIQRLPFQFEVIQTDNGAGFQSAFHWHVLDKGNDKLREWEDYYNYHRPHGGLGGQTSYERLT